ncbi:amino acid adenylation domain-containing protein [Nonomuraea sp. NPDC050556]|uniref:amino acid adenylation domain-containing protein n=1 Tax=Nonomuraea sp. NPDC050556 TaxID=3364369 RepID=UPI0037BBDF1C
MIEAQTRRTPDHPAVIAGTTRLTYEELDHRANDVARTLVTQGVGRGDLVGVCLHRDDWLVPALLGVWKAGAAYVPLDPAYPEERLRFMTEDAQVTTVITQDTLKNLAQGEPVRVDGDSTDAAYVIYTSGSTGTPKGVVVEHRNTMNLLRWEAEHYTAEELGGMLATASICFDPSVSQLFLPLVAGGTVILADNLLSLPTLPARDEVTTVYGVPSALAVLLKEPLPGGVRAVFSGGEPLTAALVRRIYANPGVRRVLNLYGPTECTTTCAVAEIPRDYAGEPSLGGPIAGAIFDIRDGELWISGPVVTRGYLRQPFDGTYRTGDLVKVVDGELRFAGRADDQVKVRGYRVELGEVEATLAGHPAVRRATVLAERDADGVAYLVGHVEAAEVTEPELRAWLRERLPDHLIPTRIGVADLLPLGPNGKVDKRALPRLGAARTREKPMTAPRTDDERLVTEVIAEVLGLPEVGVHDHFADLGGHSLAAARVVTELSRRLGHPVPLAAFLSHPTAAGLAAHRAEAPELVRRGRTTHPLTDMQREFWTLTRLHPDTPVTTLGIRFRIDNTDRISDALNALVAEHEVLRSTVEVGRDGVPYAVVHPPVPVPLGRHAKGENPATHVFDLTSEVPLMWASLCEDELVVVVDHFAFDGASVAVLMRALAGEPGEAPAVQVGDVATQQRQDLDGHREYWRQELDGAPVAAPPPDDLRSARIIRKLPDIEALAEQCGATPYAVCLAAVALASGEPDTLVGAVAARRARTELTDVVGPLVDTLPIRLRPTGDLTFQDLVRQAAEATTRALIHQEIPPAELPRAPVLLAMQHADIPVRLDGVELLTELGTGASVHELSVLVNRTAEGAELHLEYATSRLGRKDAEAYMDRLLWFLQSEPDSRLELVTPDERALLLDRAAGPELPDFPPTVVQALAVPRKGTAAIGPDGTELTHAELDAWSARLASALVERGVRRGDVVGVRLPRDHRLPVALLAVWRAGAAYLPLDPDHPEDRLRWLAEDAGARLVLTADDLGAVGQAALPQVEPGDLAYVIYTSGSTGKPKGVEVTHGNLAAYVAGVRAELGLDESVVHAAVAPLTFDISVTELWLTLSTGGTVVVVDRETAVDGHALAARIEASGVTMLDLVPTTYRMLLAAGWQGGPGLLAIAGGESLDPALAGQIRERVGQLWNGYGPTEATVGVTLHRVGADEPGPIPIGRPTPGDRVYVVDHELRLVPPGAIGELLIGGAGVARGYRGRQDLTAAAFADDPFVPGGRVYRTGDLVRWREDGRLEFHGRRDHQVKVRGYRIELGEIEEVLREVADGVVTVSGEGAQAHLVGYVTADAEGAERHVRSRLPGHLVPRRWVVLPALPTLPNGKVDRSALPDPGEPPAASRRALSSDPEHLVAEVWSAVLERPEIWADDDFFALGGHSFAATRVVGRLHETLALAVPVRLLFERPVLADFASGLEELLVAELMGGNDA